MAGAVARELDMGGVFEEDELLGVVVTFRIKGSEHDDLLGMMEREAAARSPGAKKLRKSRFLSNVMGLGLDAYESFSALKGRFTTVCEAREWDRREGLRRVLEAGIAALEKPSKR